MADVEFVLPTWQAVLLCLMFAGLYVGSLYVWGKSTREKNRDHPDVIKKRFISVTIVCLIVPVILWSVSKKSEKAEDIVYHDFIPEGRTVNKEMYVDIFHHLRDAIKKKTPRKIESKLLDSAP